ncbi:MJ0042-type zinc finger domain-containing protein, partial [Duganella callida]
MALATKCPHCNTVFRVAHDQLKLRGGIVRCGACNEVFDGNAALLEPPAPPPVTSPLPEPTPFDQKMAALDTRAAATLSAPEAEPALDLDSPPVLPAQAETDTSPPSELSMDARPRGNDDESAAPFPLPAAPAIPPVDTEALFDLDLDMDTEPELESTIEHEPSAEHALEALNVDSMSDEELEAALEAELAAMEQTMADVQHDADGQPLADDPFAAFSDGRREPTWDEPPLDEPQAGAGPRLDAAFAAAADAVFSAEDETAAASPHAGIDADLASFAAGDIDH